MENRSWQFFGILSRMTLIIAVAVAFHSSPVSASHIKYFEDFNIDGPAPSEYAPVGGASLSVVGGNLTITPSGAGGQQGFELTYPTIVGDILAVNCTMFEVDLATLIPSVGDALFMTFFDAFGSDEIEIVTTTAFGGAGAIVTRNGAGEKVITGVVIPAGFTHFRIDKVNGRLIVELVRADGTFEEIIDVDPPDAPYTSMTFTTNTSGFSIGSVEAGQHVPEPSTALLLGMGLVGLGMKRRRVSG